MTTGLVIDGVHIGRDGRPVVADVSFCVPPGEIVTIIGPNGAGKTSLIAGILGVLPLAAGRVTFQGRPLRTLPARSAVFSYMPEEAEPPAEVRVGTLLAHAQRFGRPANGLAAELAQQLGLSRLVRERAGPLSRGQKRRLSLFFALCTSRPVVVLDEPLGTFDPLQLLGVLGVLRARAGTGAALLLSVHQMADAEKIASRILVLDTGRAVAFGTLAALRARAGHPNGSLEEVFLHLLQTESVHAGA